MTYCRNWLAQMIFGRSFGLAVPLALSAFAILVTGATAFPTPMPVWLSRKDTDADPTQVGSLAETQAYYTTIGAPATLDGWKALYMSQGDEVHAIYYNRGDLGFGRDMHCRPIVDTGEVACYVTNYALGPGSPPEASLAAAIRDQTTHDQTLFRAATVAMVYNTDVATNEVTFYVYGPNGNRLDSVALDSQGPKFVPQLCLPCHGGDYNALTNSVTGGRFLPFDLEAFDYSKEPGFSRIEQEDEFRALNQLVLQTNTSSQSAELIAGWYDGPTLPRLTQNNHYVPSGYDTNQPLYNQTVKPYCRTCHVAQTFSLAAPTFFALPGELSARESIFLAPSRILTRTMPHAEKVFHNFWSTDAPAQLAANQGWSLRVTHLTDEAPNGCTADHCTLREAILAANAVAADQLTPIITFAIEGEIQLNGSHGDDSAQSGDLDITRGLFILGAGADRTIINGRSADRVFHILSQSDVLIQGMTIQRGQITDDSDGGGILNQGAGRLTLRNCVIRNNEVSGLGSGAGLANLTTATTEIERCSIIDNRTSGGGGGVYNQGVLSIHNSTISSNEAVIGGGIFNLQPSLDSPHQITLVNNTVTRNTATGSSQNAAEGGGIYLINGQITLQSNIVAGNLADAGADCQSLSGPTIFASAGYNLLGGSCPPNSVTDRTWPGALSSVLDPNLSELTSDDPLPHHALVAGSPAIDMIPFVVEPPTPNCVLPTYDQRNVARPLDGDSDGDFACDSGAYEFSPTVDFILASDTQSEFFDGAAWRPAILAQTDHTWTTALAPAQWLWKSAQVTADEALNGTDIVTFRRRFHIPANATAVSGIIQITADNAYRLSLNGTIIGADGVLDPAGQDLGLLTVETYAFSPVPGDNEVLVEVLSYQDAFGRNDPAFNPAGVIFLGQVTYSPPTCCAIRGRITDNSGAPLSGVNVSNGVTTVATDAAGVYTFALLPSGSYTVTPTLSGFTFEPPKRTVTAPPDAADQDFIARSIPVNRAPVAHGQTVTTTVNSAKNISLAGSDADGDPLTFTVVTHPAHGSVSAPPNLVYTPHGDFIGADSFTFKVHDGLADSNLATVMIQVVANPPVNHPPTANGQLVTVLRNQTTTIVLSASDADSDPLTYSIVSNPAHGAISGQGARRSYRPNTGYLGPDSFTFKVRDGQIDSAVATVTIDVQRRAGGGALAGQVVFDGQAAANATVQISDATDQPAMQSAEAANTQALTGTLRLVTDNNGFFQQDDLLEGRYVISASATISGVARRLQSEAVVVAAEQTVTQLRLQTALESQRQVIISGTLTVGGALTETFVIAEVAALSPQERSQRLMIVQCHGGHVQVVIDIALQLQADDRSVAVVGEAQLGRGNICANAVRQDAAPLGLTLAENSTDAVGVSLTNSTSGGRDRAQLDLRFHNQQQTPTAAAPMSLQRGGRLVTPDGVVDLVFPPRRSGPAVTVNYTRRAPTAITPQPNCNGGLACHFVQHFSLDAYTPDGTPITQFSEPYSLLVFFREAYLRGQTIDPTSVRPVYFDGRQWVEIFPCAGCTIDVTNGVLTVVLDHFSEFALIGTVLSPAEDLYLPVVLR